MSNLSGRFVILLAGARQSASLSRPGTTEGYGFEYNLSICGVSSHRQLDKAKSYPRNPDRSRIEACCLRWVSGSSLTIAARSSPVHTSISSPPDLSGPTSRDLIGEHERKWNLRGENGKALPPTMQVWLASAKDAAIESRFAGTRRQVHPKGESDWPSARFL